MTAGAQANIIPTNVRVSSPTSIEHQTLLYLPIPNGLAPILLASHSGKLSNNSTLKRGIPIRDTIFKVLYTFSKSA